MNAYERIREAIALEEFKNETNEFWGGAELIIKNTKLAFFRLKKDAGKAEFVINTPFNKELIWLIKELYKVVDVDYITKYTFTNAFALYYDNYVKNNRVVAVKEMLNAILNDTAKDFRLKEEC